MHDQNEGDEGGIAMTIFADGYVTNLLGKFPWEIMSRGSTIEGKQFVNSRNVIPCKIFITM